MSSPSVTYTLTNGTTADATQVAQNFTDLVNALADGLKDITIGTLAVNGNVTLGDASSDVVTLTASLGSTILPSVSNTYDLGSSSFLFKRLYFGTQAFGPNGSLANPSYSFSSDTAMGFYRSAAGSIGVSASGAAVNNNSLLCKDTSASNCFIVANLNERMILTGASSGATGGALDLFGNAHGTYPNMIKFFNGGTESGSISSAGLWTIGASGSGSQHVLNGRFLDIQASSAGVAGLLITNANNAAAGAHAEVELNVGGTSGGDPYIRMNISGGQGWSAGVDNSDGDKYKVSASTAVGTNDYLTIDPASAFTMASVGNAQAHTWYGASWTHSAADSAILDLYSSGTNDDCVFRLFNNGSSTGDQYIQWFEGGASASGWCFGRDDSDSGALVLSAGAALGTANRMHFNSTVGKFIHGAGGSFRVYASDGTTLGFMVDDTPTVTIGSGTATQHVLNTLLATNGSQTATMTNLPAAATAGNPAVWIKITINGSTRYIPAWA